MVTMNDIISIVRKSIERKFRIESGYGFINIDNGTIKLCFICGYKYYNHNKNVLSIRTSNNGKSPEIELSEEDMLRWKLLNIECNNYQNEVAINDINNFFSEEDDSKPTTINDLDSEDD